MLYDDDFNSTNEYETDSEEFEEKINVDENIDGSCYHGQPSCMCMIMGIKIMKSAVEFENTLSDYLRCQCRIIRRLIRNEQYDLIDSILKQMSDTLHQIYNVESQIIEKIEKGACLSNCLEPEG